jgi:hypothetical protein
LPKTINSTDHHSHCLPRTFPLRATGACTARTTASCTRLPCVPERCAHLQTMCTHMLCTPSASAPTRWRHVPAGRCGRRVGDEVYGSTGRRSTLRRAPPTRSAVRRSLRKVDHLPVSRPSQTGCRVLARAPPPPPSSARQRLCRARAMEQQPLVRLIAPWASLVSRTWVSRQCTSQHRKYTRRARACLRKDGFHTNRATASGS